MLTALDGDAEAARANVAAPWWQDIDEQESAESLAAWSLEKAAMEAEVAALSDDEWAIALRRSYRCGRGSDDEQELRLDTRVPLGDACRVVDLGAWTNVDATWPSAERMATAKPAWRVFVCAGASLTDDGLCARVLASGLRVLELANCALLTDAALGAIAETCPELYSLDVSGCSLISDAGLDTLTRSCSRVRNINLSACVNVTDQGLSVVIERCFALRHVQCRENQRLCGSAFLALPSAHQDVALLVHHHLRVLDLSNCASVGDEAVRWIVEAAFALQELLLVACEGVTDYAVQCLPLAAHLEIVDLSRCWRLSDACADSLAQVQSLRTLRIDAVASLTPRFLSEYLRQAPRQLACLQMMQTANFGLPATAQGVALEAVRVSESVLLGPASLRRMARLQFLSDLCIRACPQVTNEVLREVLAATRSRLRALDVAFCSGLFGTAWCCRESRLLTLDCSGVPGLATEAVIADLLCASLRRLVIRAAGPAISGPLLRQRARGVEIVGDDDEVERDDANAKTVEMLRRRLELEQSAALRVQRAWRRFAALTGVSLRYLLIRHRREAPAAASGLQKLWRGHRVLHHRRVQELVVRFQRGFRRAQWRRRFDLHMRQFRSEWSAATQIEACARGWLWRRAHADVVLALAVKKKQREVLHVVEEAVSKSQMLIVSRGANVQMSMPVPAQGLQRTALEELTMVLAPAREILALRKLMMQELQLVLEKRMREREAAMQELYRMRRSQFGLNARILQKWAREQVLPGLARAARAAERARRSDLELAYFDEVSAAREAIALRGVCKLQARMRGHLQRTQPDALARMSAKNIPRFLVAVDAVFAAQQKAMDQISQFNSLLSKCEANQQHFSGLSSGTAKAKHKFYGNMAASAYLRVTMCERFEGNYAKRLRFHMATAALVRDALKRMQSVDNTLTLLESFLAKRTDELDCGAHGYDVLDDAKVRLLFAQAGPEGAAALTRELVGIERQWIADCTSEVRKSRAQCLTMLRNFAGHEMMRLEMELATQREIMRAYREIDDIIRQEWAWRRELLSTDLGSVHTSDVDTRAYLKLQTNRLEDRLAASVGQNEPLVEAFVSLCTGDRMACAFPDKHEMRRLERSALQIRREVKYRAWTAVIPLQRLKPAELVAVQERLLKARNRVDNDHAHRAALDAQAEGRDAGEDDEEEIEEDLDETERMIRDLLDDAVKHSNEDPDALETERAGGLDGLKEMLLTEREREKRRMRAVIIERQRGALGLAEGIASLKLTVGADEELAMKLLNGKLRKRGLNIWRCIRRDMRQAFQVAEPVYLWTRTSTETRHHVREIVIDCEVDPRRGPVLGRHKFTTFIGKGGDESESDESDGSESDSSEGTSSGESDDGVLKDLVEDEAPKSEDAGGNNHDGMVTVVGLTRATKRRASQVIGRASRKVSSYATHAAGGRASSKDRSGKLTALAARVTQASRPRGTGVSLREAVSHPKIPTFALLVSRHGTADQTIVDLRISIGDADLETLERRGFACVEGEMSVPEKKRERVREQFKLWFANSATYTAPQAVDLEKLRERRAEFQEMFDQNPGNKRVGQILHELDLEIKETEFNREGEDDEALKLRKLQQTINSVSMSKKDTRKMMACFTAMDTEHEGEVTLGQFLYYIGVDESALARRIFSFLDLSGNGSMDFQELLHAVSTLGMFGPRELVRLVFNFADTEGKGTLSYEALKRAMVLQHELDPVDHIDLKRVLQYVERIYGTSLDLTFDQVHDLHVKYPLIFQPAFEIKIAVCKTFLGEAYWDRKRELFAEVREELRKKNQREKDMLKREKIRDLQRQINGESVAQRLQTRFYDALDRIAS